MASPAMVVRVAANLAEFRANLKEGKDQIEATAAGMKKLGESISGDKLIRDANNIVAAIGSIENATKLTTRQKEQFNAKLTEALQKLNLLGVQGPTAMVAMEQATRTTSAAVGDDSGGLVGKFNMLRNALVALGVAKYVSEAVAYGSQLTKLAASTGLTVQELQRLNFAGAQVGVSMEASARAIQRLQRSLIDGDNSAVKAVENLGLNIKQLIAMSPADMFDVLSAAIAKLPTPAMRSAAAIEILGRQGGELLPLLLADVNKLADGFVGMSDAAVAGADKFDSAWATAKIRVKSAVGELIGAFASLETAWEFLTRDPAEFEFKRLTAEIDRQIESITNVARATSAYGSVTATASMSTKDIKAAMADAKAEADKLAAEIKKAEEEARRFQERIRGLADQMGGQGLQQQIRETGLALADLAARGLKPSEEELAKLIPRLREWEAAGNTLPPNLQKIVTESNRFSDSVLKARGLLYDQIATLEEFNATTEATGSAVEAMVNQWNRLFANARPLNDLFNGVTFGSAPGAGSGTSGSMMQDLWDEATRLQTKLPEVTDVTVDFAQAMNSLIGASQNASSAISTFGGIVAAVVGGPYGMAISMFTSMAAMGAASAGDWRANVDALNEQIGELGGTPIDSSTLRGGNRELLDALIGQYRELRRATDEAADAQRRLDEAIRQESEAIDRVRKLTEEYGISFDALGNKIVEADLIEWAKKFGDDFAFLIGRGGELSVVLAGMKDEAQLFLNRALRFGIEVPDSMRPLFAALIEAGLLTDGAGVKLTDISQVDFEETIGNSIKNVGDEIAKLPEAIAEAFRRMFTQVDDDARFVADNLRAKFGNMKFRAEFTTEAPEDGEGGPEPKYSFAGGSGGFRDFGRGTTVVLHGRERVQTEAQARSGDGTAALQAEMRGLRRLMEDNNVTLALAMRDALSGLRRVV